MRGLQKGHPRNDNVCSTAARLSWIFEVHRPRHQSTTGSVDLENASGPTVYIFRRYRYPLRGNGPATSAVGDGTKGDGSLLPQTDHVYGFGG